MSHKIAEWINKVPDNTIEVKKALAAAISVHSDSVNRWYNNPETKIDVNTSLKILLFFQKYWPELTITDLFNEETIASDEGLV